MKLKFKRPFKYLLQLIINKVTLLLLQLLFIKNEIWSESGFSCKHVSIYLVVLLSGVCIILLVVSLSQVRGYNIVKLNFQSCPVDLVNSL